MDLGKERGIFYKDQCQRYGKGDCKRTAGRDFSKVYLKVGSNEGRRDHIYISARSFQCRKVIWNAMSESTRSGAEFRFPAKWIKTR